MSITIATDKLNEIKSATGYPIEDEKFLLTDDQIKEFCIRPALRLYFSKFPKIATEDRAITYNEGLTIPFPDTYTFGVVDARIANTDFINTGGGMNQFLYLASHNAMVTGYNYGKKGYNPNSLSQANQTAIQALKSQNQMNKTVRIRVDYTARTVDVFTNRAGKFIVDWAKYSDNFADVRFVYVEDVIKLSQGLMMKHAGRTLGIFSNTNMPVTINADFLNSEGEALITEVKEKWAEIPGTMLVKG